MFNSSKNILKARCDSLSVVLKLLFWVYAIYLIIFLGTGLWLMFQPSGDFGIRLLDTGNGIAGYGFFKGGLEVDFARDLLNGKSMESPKNVYLAGYLESACATSAGFWYSMIIGGIIISLSYIFEYGTSLQIESDETL